MSAELGSLWPKLLAHLDALRAAPRTYLLAMWWRLIGKRLRARSRIAPLLGGSTRAYDLWILQREAGRTPAVDASDPPIVALIDGKSSSAFLADTIRSLDAEGVSAFIVGGPDIPDPAEAARRIDWNKNPWLMPLAAGDILAPGASSAYRAAAAGSEARIIYADDDLLDHAGRRTAPHFKPGWNRELFRHFDYLTGACMVRVSSANLISLGSDDWMQQLVRSALDRAAPVHVPFVLHHRRARPSPCPPPPIEVRQGALPLVSVIVPTRDRVDLLRPCLEGVFSRTDYRHIEVIVVDNDSTDPATLAFLGELQQKGIRVLHHSGPFNFSAINNRAAEEARGTLLCLLNNDVEVIHSDWLSTMAMQALRNDVGAVGAQLLYPDGRIQHAGVVLGICGGAAHAHRFMWPNEEGFFRRHLLPQFVSAVTAACLVVRRDRFLAVGGLDAENFPVAFNDVDLCMRLNQRGWQSLYEPRARLIHHESVSRGEDREPADAARFAREMRALQDRWGTTKHVDPFHHPELSPLSEQFVVKL